jgi:hypothetical protein
MVSREHKLDEVYGVAREVPANYVSRGGVDGAFVNSLARDKHVVVFGSSKQGKTTLRKHTLSDDDYVVVVCNNRWTNLSFLFTAILKAAGYTVAQSSTKTVGGTYKVTAKIEGALHLPLVAKGKTGGDAGYERASEVTTKSAALELDPMDVNDIIIALENLCFDRYIFLEDFHYLPESTQTDFAVALKAFHEQSKLTFVVVGVWLDENRLIVYNGDLTERLIAVNADAWSPSQLREVIEKGEKLLNIEISEEFKVGVIKGCFESVSVVQETCHKLCEDAGVFATRAKREVIGSSVDAGAMIRGVIEKQSARYTAFLRNFAEGFQTTELEMYRWLLLPVLRASPQKLERGLTYAEIRQIIDANHPTGKVNAGNITQALQSAAALQVGKLNVKPIILDYDQSARRMNVVDRSFLIWLGHQDRGELLAEAGLPKFAEDPRQLGF